MTIQVTADFGGRVVTRTGVHRGYQAAIEPAPCDNPGDVWIKCPDIEELKDGEVVTRNDGYMKLHSHEYRVLEN